MPTQAYIIIPQKKNWFITTNYSKTFPVKNRDWNSNIVHSKIFYFKFFFKYCSSFTLVKFVDISSCKKGAKNKKCIISKVNINILKVNTSFLKINNKLNKYDK